MKAAFSPVNIVNGVLSVSYLAFFVLTPDYTLQVSYSFIFLLIFWLKMPRHFFGYMLLAWVMGNFLVWIASYALFRFYFFSISEFDYCRGTLFNLFLIPINALLRSGKRPTRASVPTFSKADARHLGRLYQRLTIFVLVILAGYVLAGGLKAREEIGNYVTEADPFYYVRAFLPLFFVQGFMTGYLLKQRHWIGVFAFSAVMLAYFFGGHRGDLFLTLLSFLIGRWWVIKLTLRTYFFAIFTALASFMVFGYISAGRLQPEFTRSPPDEVIAKLLQSDQFLQTLDRVIEPSGQRVIDYTMSGRYEYFYFDNFSRLITIPIPAFLVRKGNNDDGPETLEAYYGYELSDFHSVPITWLADAFRRFGFLGVPIISLLFYVIFWLLSKLVYSLMAAPTHHRVVIFLLLSSILIRIFRLPPASLLGAFSFFLYDLPKTYLLLLGISYLSKIR
ncbi:hypothetical protein [Spirosoma flavum]|uniref:Oligosaccharide repeat unit polymerase n=1 Tax=Spirosoma flavum TaxID=2048557 RepID=A0ABW6ANF1_9BACT